MKKLIIRKLINKRAKLKEYICFNKNWFFYLSFIKGVFYYYLLEGYKKTCQRQTAKADYSLDLTEVWLAPPPRELAGNQDQSLEKVDLPRELSLSENSSEKSLDYPHLRRE